MKENKEELNSQEQDINQTPEDSSEGRAPEENQTESQEKPDNQSDEEIEEFSPQGKQKITDRIKARAVRTGAAIKNTATTIFKVATNPIFWTTVGVVSGMVVIGITIFTFTKTLGPSNYAQKCSPSSGSGYINEASIKDEETKRSAVISWFTLKSIGGQSLSTEQAIAITANLVEHNELKTNFISGAPTNSEKDPTTNEIKNEHIAASNVAIGLMKWSGEDKNKLVAKATEEGRSWTDINVQLSFLLSKLDENKSLKESEFHKATLGTEEYAKIFAEKVFDVKGNRVKGIQDKALALQESHKTAKNFIVNCSGAEVDTSNVIKLIDQVTYKLNDYYQGKGRTKCKHWRNCGLAEATPEYREAKKIAEQNSTKDPLTNLLASCDRFVATILKSTKVDVNFPWGATADQYKYLTSSPKWKEVKCQDRKPGDVMITRGNGHIMIYTGKIDGKETTASASWLERVAHKFHAGSVCNSDGSWTGDTWPVMSGFRRVEGGK